MEIHFDLGKSLKSSPVQRLDASTLKWMTPQRDSGVYAAVDKIGALSAEAQGLKRPLTTFEKLLNSDDEQCLYLMWHKKDDSPSVSIVYGFLRTCRRRLYLNNNDQQCTIASPISVMDFFVHPSVQKQGYAFVLFNNMLEAEKVEPYQCAYDKPSASLLKFLHKHYGLQEPVMQSTNFAVFPQFFESPRAEDLGSASQGSSSARTASTPRHSTDMAGKIIHGDLPPPTKMVPAPDSAQGRKYTRDFGHQAIW